MTAAFLEHERDVRDPRLGDLQPFYGTLPPSHVDIFFAEPHMHALYEGDDGSAPIEDIVITALENGIHVVALTGHNTTGPSLAAREFVRKEGLEPLIRFPVAEEVDSQHGHLGLIGIAERGIPRGLSAPKTIAAGHEDGGIVLGNHFELRWVNSMPLWVAERLQGPHSSTQLDGGEYLNGGTALANRDSIGRVVYGKDTDARARRFFTRKGVQMTPIGATDGHARSVGLIRTAFWGCSEEEAVQGTGFEDAVRAGRTAVVYDPVIDTPGWARRENRDSLVAWPRYLADKYLSGKIVIDLFSRRPLPVPRPQQ